jgi:ribose 5-phosphate isomerase A
VYSRRLDVIFRLCACGFRGLNVSTSRTKVDLESEKRLAAETVARWIPDNVRIGIGSGSTSAYFICSLGQRVRTEGLRVSGVPTSLDSAELARAQGVPLLEPAPGLHLDFTVDGADEISPNLDLIKGGGGKLFREKVIASASGFLLVVADSSKPVSVLGAMPVPVEVIPFAAPWVMERIAALGGAPVRREHSGTAVLTDQGNWLLDCQFGPISDPAALGRELKTIPGILEHGLFVGLAKLAVIGDGDRALLFRANKSAVPAASFSSVPPLS